MKFAVCTYLGTAKPSTRLTSAGTPGGKTVDKEPDDDYVIVPTDGKWNMTRLAGSELELRAKLANRVVKVTVNASKALGVGKTPTQQLEEMLDMSVFLEKRVAGQ